MPFCRVAIVSATALVGAAAAQPFSGTISQPSIDRWNYPFASQPGAEQSVPVFAAIRQAGFDDRDALFLLTFNTDGLVPTGLNPDRYAVSRVRVTAWTSSDNQFRYDPSFDSVRTSYDPADPQFLPDADAGKPIELFPVGYRNNWTALTYQESSAYSPFPPFPPQEGVRNVFAAVYDEAGLATDVGRHVRQQFEAPPLAIGQTDDVTPGELVPAGTAFTFDADVTSAPAQAYFARGFAQGRLPLIISGLQAASGGPGGGTGDPNYPSFFTKENATAQIAGYIARVDIEVIAYPGADFNFDGGVDGSDVEAFFLAWEAGETIADFNIDGGVDGNDVEAFFVAWENG